MRNQFLEDTNKRRQNDDDYFLDDEGLSDLDDIADQMVRVALLDIDNILACYGQMAPEHYRDEIILAALDRAVERLLED